MWLDGKRAAQWFALCRWPDAAFCFSDYDAVDVRERIIANAVRSRPGYALLIASERSFDAVRYESDGFVRAVARSMCVEISSIAVNRTIFAGCGGFDSALEPVADLALLWRLAARAPAIAIERALASCARRPEGPGDRLASVDATERLWTSVRATRKRYPAAAVDLVRRGGRELRIAGGHLPHHRVTGAGSHPGEREGVPFGRHQ